MSHGKYAPKINSCVVFDNDSFIPIMQSDESHGISLTENYRLYKNATLPLRHEDKQLWLIIKLALVSLSTLT